MAAYITGGVTVPGAAGGIIVSGLIVKVSALQYYLTFTLF